MPVRVPSTLAPKLPRNQGQAQQGNFFSQKLPFRRAKNPEFSGKDLIIQKKVNILEVDGCCYRDSIPLLVNNRQMRRAAVWLVVVGRVVGRIMRTVVADGSS